MPRRRGPKVRPVDRKNKRQGAIRRWNNKEDIPLDEVDEFHEQRDKIFLDGEGVAHDSDEEEEVFALDNFTGSSEEEHEDEHGVDESFEEEGAPQKPTKRKGKKKEKTSKAKKKDETTDEEEEEEEEEESWGKKKSAYYSSNAAQLDSDDEEAHEMEEQEARRIQAKLREPMCEEDFGFIDAQQVAVQTQAEDQEDIWKPVANLPPAPEATDKISVLRHMEKTCPETLALAQDWEDVARSVIKTEQKLSEIEKSGAKDKALGLLHVYHQTQLTYAALVAFYLHLRTSERYASRPDLLQQHPILKRLLVLKQSLITLEELGFSLSDSEDDEDAEDLDSEDSAYDGMDRWLAARKLGLDIGELEDLLRDADEPDETPDRPVNGVKTKPVKKAKVNEPPKKKRKIANGDAAPKVVFDVEEPTLPSKKTKNKDKIVPSTATRSIIADAYGEATGLDAADAADKGGRRRALRFHTSKIENASTRRQNARAAMGGDEDIPYRQRRKEAELRQKRTNLGGGGDDLDDEEPELPQRAKRGRDTDADEPGIDEADDDDDDDGYYSLIKKQKKDKKAQKKAEYEAQKEAIRNSSFDNDDIVDGQRGITRAILTNKGLTPKRSKTVRNPRVKKRQKFDKAKKKLASQKAVYKGGLSETGGYYGGEKSGISKVVKSVKF